MPDPLTLIDNSTEELSNIIVDKIINVIEKIEIDDDDDEEEDEEKKDVTSVPIKKKRGKKNKKNI